MCSGSASLLHATVNQVSLALAITPPADAEELRSLTPRSALRGAVHAISEAFVAAASSSHRLDEEQQEAKGPSANHKKVVADLEVATDAAVRDAGEMQKKSDDAVVAHKAIEDAWRAKEEDLKKKKTEESE